MARGLKTLSAKEDRCCESYAATNNGKVSALIAGYGVGKDGTPNGKAAAVQACRLLKREDIRERIDALRQNAANEVGATPIYCARLLKRVADRCIQDVRPQLRFDPMQGKMVETGEYVFSSAGAVRALSQLVRMHETLAKAKENGETGERELDVVLTVVTPQTPKGSGGG